MEIHSVVKGSTEVEMDMTPMIDIVFLLIIFFMIVTELSNLDIVQLILPVADQATIKEPIPDSKVVTVNIQIDEKDDQFKLGQIVIGGEKVTLEQLINRLEFEVTDFDRWSPNPSDNTKQDSLLEVTIRADEGVNAGHIHEVYRACRENRIFKVRMAALNERLENPYEEFE